MKEVSSGNYISDDIAFCILSNLPAKSIKRFSCVRKSWSLLLENPNFFKMFRDNLISKPHPLYDDACLILNQYLYSDDSWNFYFLSGDKFQNRVRFNLPPPFNFNNLQRTIIHILGSSVNGILCICGIDHYGAKNTILWNPEIDQVKVIPSGIVELPPKVRSEIKLHGFGYDHVRSDYKVIRHVDMITFNNNPWDVVKHEPSWEIYSLKSDSWRKTDFDMPARLLAADSDAYLNGICHWCAEANSNVNLVSFDLSNEVYFVTPLPLEGMYDDFGYSVQVLNGFVAVILKLVKDMSFHDQFWVSLVLRNPGLDSIMLILFPFNILFNLFWLAFHILSELGRRAIYSSENQIMN